MGNPDRSSTLPSSWKQLTGEEVYQFIQQGYLVVRKVFSRELAERIVPMVWSELDIDPNNRSAWTSSKVMLRKVLEEQPCPQIFTRRYVGAVDDICGPGRWAATRGVGHWVILLPGFANTPWHPPQHGWHVDISLDHPCIVAPGMGLITLELFSDIQPGDGGTAIRVGSHSYLARILAIARANRFTERELLLRALADTKHLPIAEVTGQAGDLLLMHPLTVHAGTDNTGDHARIAAVKLIRLYEPLNLAREDAFDYSPVEQAIVNALAETQPPV
jgi:hypothetical protein